MILSTITGFVYQKIAKPVLFCFSADKVHAFIVGTAYIIGKIAPLRAAMRWAWRYDNPVLSQQIAGLNFANPVGLSAGFDKNCKLTKFLPSVGFGFAECGSITALPGKGNNPPHYRRLPKTKSILVNAGLNNDGVDAIVARLKQLSPQGQINPLNISVAKTNIPANVTDQAAVQDYMASLRALRRAKLGQMYTLNISCPNAYGGEPFTTPSRLNTLLAEVDKLNLKVPVFVKMPIDHTWPQFKQLLDVILAHNVAGVTIGNLRKDRVGASLKDDLPSEWPGNLSGKPTQELSDALIGQTYLYCGNRLAIIGVGGISSAADAYRKIKLGASLVELITGLIFEGPQIVGQINRQLVDMLAKDGYSSISQAVGSAHKK